MLNFRGVALLLSSNSTYKNYIIFSNQRIGLTNSQLCIDLGKGWLVGGWTNPFEKYDRQIGFIFPN